MYHARVGNITIGPGAHRLTLIAGPCVAESRDLCLSIARQAAEMCRNIGFDYVFKASYDKANRTSSRSIRGPGLDEGLAILSDVRSSVGVPVCTDIHEPWQAGPVSQVADMLQVPAFLSRQTDMIHAAARTGRCINVKKGQFLAPWDMRHVIAKAVAEGNTNLLLTERGVSFGYNALVVDMCALPIMRGLGHPVCLDATHAVQMPGSAGETSGGRREYVGHLARAAAAVGIDALFLEVHPEPERAQSDAATMLALGDLPTVLQQVQAVFQAMRPFCVERAGPADTKQEH